MTAKAKVSSAMTVFCDDLRLEHGGKLSAMGIYQGYMALPEPELLLPKLVAWTAISVEPGWSGGQVHVRLHSEDGVLTQAHFDFPALAENQQHSTLNIPLEIIPFTAKVGTALRITITAPGLNYESPVLRIVGQ